METTTGTTTVKLHGASAKSFANAIDELKSLGAIFDPEDKTWTLDGALVIGTDGTGETVVRHDSDPLNSLCFLSRLYRGGCLDIEATEPEAVTEPEPATATSATQFSLAHTFTGQRVIDTHHGAGTVVSADSSWVVVDFDRYEHTDERVSPFGLTVAAEQATEQCDHPETSQFTYDYGPNGYLNTPKGERLLCGDCGTDLTEGA